MSMKPTIQNLTFNLLVTLDKVDFFCIAKGVWQTLIQPKFRVSSVTHFEITYFVMILKVRQLRKTY